MNLPLDFSRDVAQQAERRALASEVTGSSPVVSATLSDSLVSALTGRQWVTREKLSHELRVSVRAIRDAASQSRGRVICGNRGLRLTVEASDEEVDECCGRFTSQIHEMSRRVVEIRAVRELQDQSEARLG